MSPYAKTKDQEFECLGISLKANIFDQTLYNHALSYEWSEQCHRQHRLPRSWFWLSLCIGLHFS